MEPKFDKNQYLGEWAYEVYQKSTIRICSKELRPVWWCEQLLDVGVILWCRKILQIICLMEVSIIYAKRINLLLQVTIYLIHLVYCK